MQSATSSASPAGRHEAGNDRPESSDGKKTDKKTNATTGASAAGVRALTARLAAFYFRAPTKFFFRTRIDYLAYPRALLNPTTATPQRWSLAQTTPGILASAVRTYGWSFIPQTVLPPLLANVTVGAVLYTTYLSTLALYHPASAAGQKRAYPPPPPSATFAAGATAGLVQSVVAAPLDALTVRFRTRDLLEGRYGSMWSYAWRKGREIGTRGAFAGLGLSAVKDSVGAGLFFGVFEAVKAQGFYAFVRWSYGLERLSVEQRVEIAVQSYEARRDGDWEGGEGAERRPVIKPHYLMEPGFLLLAGVSASVAQQVVLHPLTQVQEVHYRRFEGLDRQMVSKPSRVKTMKLYGQAYRKTFLQCLVYAKKAGSWRRWLFADFWMSTLRQVPSTSAGLIVFEIFRRKYGLGSDAARIQMDGYDILLP